MRTPNYLHRDPSAHVTSGIMTATRWTEAVKLQQLQSDPDTAPSSSNVTQQLFKLASFFFSFFFFFFLQIFRCFLTPAGVHNGHFLFFSLLWSK